MIWAKHNPISTISVNTVKESVNSGERLPESAMGQESCERFPLTVALIPNDQFVAVRQDVEYTVYSALNLRRMSFGSAEEVVKNSCTR